MRHVTFCTALGLAMWLGYVIGCRHGDRIGYMCGRSDAHDRIDRAYAGSNTEIAQGSLAKPQP
jgi:hypothetical protein